MTYNYHIVIVIVIAIAIVYSVSLYIALYIYVCIEYAADCLKVARKISGTYTGCSLSVHFRRGKVHEIRPFCV